MSLLTPLALALGALAIPIVLLYMLRLRRRDVTVSSTLLWAHIVRDREANAPWQRLRRNWLLLLQLLILAALVIALARPYVIVPVISAGRIALLLDASASMNATDVAPSRFEAARAQALALVDTLGSADNLAVIRVGAGPEVLVPYTNDQDRLRAAIRGAQPGMTGADWASALTLAAAGAAGADKFSIVIIGDGGLPSDLPPVPGIVRYIPIGQSDANVAIGALAVSAVPGQSPQLYARLTNYGSQPADVIFSLSLDGTLFNAQAYTVPANASTNVVMDKLPGTFHNVKAQITRPASSTVPDYLSEDDTAYAVYNPASAGRALLMTAQNKFLTQGFASLPGWQAFSGQLNTGLPTEPFDLYVFDGWLPPTLPNAAMLIINPPATSQTPLLIVTGTVTTPTQGGNVTPNDPRTDSLRVDNVHVRQYETINAPWATPLIQAADGGSLLLAGEYNGHRVAIIPFDLHDSDLPLQIAWPILLSNLANWYQAPHALQSENGIVPGQTVLIRPAPGADAVQVRRPDGSTATLLPSQDALVYNDTEQPGIYDLNVLQNGKSIQQEAFSVNLFDPLESHIAPAPTLPIGNIAPTSSAPQDTGQREYWPWIAGLALVLLALEWYAYQRSQQLPLSRAAGRTSFRVSRASQKRGTPRSRRLARFTIRRSP
ncbi:MAG: vWA domain-containing protein [Aggregatilineales bacterium]